MAKPVKLVMGTNSFGDPPPSNVGKYLTQEEVKKAVAVCRDRGIIEFDTARIYTAGNSEVTLGHGLRAMFTSPQHPRPLVATKAHPAMGYTGAEVEKQLNQSLKALEMECVDIFYLHAPDEKVALEETLTGVDRLYRQGKFKQLGLSNYMPFQVAQIYNICKTKGYVLPTVYQGLYSLLARDVEYELFFVLRQYKIRFYAFSPLLGGLLVAKRKFEEGKPSSGRFSRATYFDAFWKKSVFDEVEKLSQICDKYKLEMREVAMRWILYHSYLKVEHGDAVILGASSVDQLVDNINVSTRGGPLSADILKDLDTQLTKGGLFLEGQWRTVQPISSL